MRGKVTYRAGRHPTRAADWVDPAPDAPAEIAELVAEGRYLRQHHAADHVSSADVIATLLALARIEDDDEALRAMAHCDSLTLAALMLPMHYATGDSTAERLRVAAEAALKRWRGRKPSRGYQVLLARAILDEWIDATGDAAPAVWGNTVTHCSPIVARAHRVFMLVEGKPFDVKRVRELMHGAVVTP